MRIKALLSIFLLLFILETAESQNYVCAGDTIILVKPDVRGDYYWQKSHNATDWTRVADQKDTLVLVPNESATYRLEVAEGECSLIYSSEIFLNYVQIPEMSIPVLDSVCQNTDPFKLSGGIPAGGNFYGESIIDGKFSPQAASSGFNDYYYLYEDLASGCKDSIFGLVKVIPVPDVAVAPEDIFLVTEDSIVLKANSPAVGEGKWRIVSGEGGLIKDPDSAETVFYRGDSYGDFVLEWTVTGTCGSSADQMAIEFVETSKNPCPGLPFVWDFDGNRYKTIQIGGQCWMAENLKVGKLVESTVQTRVHSNASDNNVIEVYGYNNSPDSLARYGGLYDWDELMNYSEEKGSQGICPDGWHVPTREEWETLNGQFPEKDAGLELQDIGNSGFNAYMSGDRNAYGGFFSFTSSAFFWTSSSWNYNGETAAYYVEMIACNEVLQRGGRFNKKTGAGVRCLKDE
jgi:uncharacterized protein (TIGR02145 family)